MPGHHQLRHSGEGGEHTHTLNWLGKKLKSVVTWEEKERFVAVKNVTKMLLLSEFQKDTLGSCDTHTYIQRIRSEESS